MFPEIGLFALILSLCMALFQAVLPLWGAAVNNHQYMAVAKSAAQGHLLFMLIAFSALTAAFITHDFSVAYVSHNSNSALPLLYMISGVWVADEGSLLFLVLILFLLTNAVLLFSKNLALRNGCTCGCCFGFNHYLFYFIHAFCI